MRCGLCGEVDIPKISRMANQMFIKLMDNTSSSEFNRSEPPKFEDYFLTGIIQYSEEKKHFRTIKMFGKNVNVVMDAD